MRRDGVSWPGRIDAMRNSTTSHMDDSGGLAYHHVIYGSHDFFRHVGNLNTETRPAVVTASKSSLQTCWVTYRPPGRSLAIPASRVNADATWVTLVVDDASPKESIARILMLA
jgi:hypothetical protein